jgi:hypothetical protein
LPIADATPNTPTVFEAIRHLSENHAKRLHLEEVRQLEDDVLWLYISLTDMAHSQMEEHIIFKWLSLKSTIEYAGEWETLFNPNFNYTEFGTIKNSAGSNNFVLSAKQWIEKPTPSGLLPKRVDMVEQRLNK